MKFRFFYLKKFILLFSVLAGFALDANAGWVVYSTMVATPMTGGMVRLEGTTNYASPSFTYTPSGYTGSTFVAYEVSCKTGIYVDVTYGVGETYTLTAQANDGYEFVGWSTTQGGVITITDLSFNTYIMTGAGAGNPEVHYYANFREKTPTLTLSPASLSLLDNEEKTFTLSGADLRSDVSVSVSGNFEIKVGSGSWASSATIAKATATAGISLYVRIKSNAGIGSHGGTITASATGATSQAISLTGSLSDTWPNAVTSVPDGYAANDIDSADDLAWFAKQGGGNGTLTADINLTGHPWVPIANYSGTFNGNGHVITGLTNKIGDNVATTPGLFATVNGGTVMNVAVNACDMQGTDDEKYYGIIANEISSGSISGCEVNGTLAGNGYLGGVVGIVNGGTVHSCVSQVAPINGGTIVHTISNGLLSNSFTNAGNNLYFNGGRDSNAQNCIYKDESWKYVNASGTEKTITIQEDFAYGEKGCVIEGDANTRLVDILNKYAKDNSCLLWAQPVTTSINSGVPVLKLEGEANNTVAQISEEGELNYGDLSTLISSSSPMLFYGKKDNMATAYEGNNLYIDEDAALKVTDNVIVNAHTSRFIKNLPSKETEVWHHYSSPVARQSLGIHYNDEGQVSWDGTPNTVLINDGTGFFPTNTTNWDLYCFYEPAYHWINFKRNSDSHWYSENHTANIAYTNETEFTPGKGYLVALASSSYVQATGNLNHGSFTVPVKVSDLSQTPGDKLEGFNLIGNPFQSYLSFKDFADVNNTLWGGSGKTATYLTYDPEADNYKQGTVTTASSGSAAASGNISMHQGFFIVATTAGNATFNDDMCSVNPEGDVHFRGEKFAYPLVNLMVRDSEGVGDVAVVEFDRPEFTAAPKLFNYGGKGKVYFSYENEDDALLFLSEAIDQLPVHFDALEDAEYTLNWSTANADFSYLHLIDNMTGADIDMLARNSYSFSATTRDYKSRFKLKFAYTGIGENEDTELVEVFAFLHDGNLIVNGQGTIDIIDLNGRTICNQKLTGEQNTVGLPNVAPGIYVVRLVNNSETKVQKIIVNK